jgi:predicted GNAT family acetyltransferase
MSEPQHEPIQVEHAEAAGRGAFFISKAKHDGVRLAEMTYVRSADALVIIDHTEVHDQLRGLGVGRMLLDTAVAWARAHQTKIIATCPYAKAQFERDASIRDVLA